MSKKISRTYTYDTTPDEVATSLVDPVYLTEKAAFLGHEDFEIVEDGVAGGVVKVVTRKTVQVEVPGFAKKFLPERNRATESHTWDAPVASEARHCGITVEIAGVPATIKGTLTLSPAGAQTQVDIAIEVKASIPMVGGKIEGLIVADLEKTIEGERAFGEQWTETH